MIKRLEYEYDPLNGDIELITSNSLIKQASLSSEMQEAIADIKPNSDKSYILINAMGCNEKWGSNKNADAFPEKALRDYHKTFEKNAYIYKHHQNKDPNKAQGRVKFSHYNRDMGRVELLLEVDKTAGANLVKRIENNEKIAFSMGCKVPYDVCTICLNKAAKSDEYCDHIKKEKNKVYPDGRKVAMLNLHPNFFDISEVTVPADRTAYIMQKVAESEQSELSAKLGEDWLNENHLKESDINKRLNIDSEPVVLETRKGRLAIPDNLPGDLPKEWLDDSLSKTSSSDLLVAMAATQIMPTPKDFQYIVLKHADARLADEWYASDILFELDKQRFEIPTDWDVRKLTKTALEQCTKVASTHSLTAPNIIARGLAKLAEKDLITALDPHKELQNVTNIYPPDRPMIKNPLFALGLLSGLYYAFNKLFKGIGIGSPSALEQTVYNHPMLLPALVGGASWGAVKSQEMLLPSSYNRSGGEAYTFTKQAATPGYWLERALVTVPGSYVYSGFQETKRQQGVPLNSAQEFVRKHPFMTSVGAFAASGPLVKGTGKLFGKYASLSSELFFNLNRDKFEDFYSDLIKIV